MNSKHLLTPAGSGLHTVHTKQELKDHFQKKFYGSDPIRSYEQSFPDSSSKGPFVIGVPFDNGAGILRGANWGPLYLRSKLLESKDHWNDLGDIKVIPHLLHDSYLSEKKLNEIRTEIHGDDKDQKLPVSPLSICEFVAEDFFTNHKVPLLVLGGDHSITRPFAEKYIESHNNAAIIHFDAHTDLMEKRLGVDMCFATWAYHLSSKINDANRFIQLGIRSSGKNKSYWQQNTPVSQYWADEISNSNLQDIVEDIKVKLERSKVRRLYVSFDIDAIDQKLASMCGTPEPDGISPHFVILLLNALAQNYKIDVIDFVEVSPYSSFDRDQVVMRNSLQTAGQLVIKFFEILEEQCQ